MPTVQAILSVKGFSIHAVSPTTTAYEATRKMNAAKIGALVVLDQGTMVGIFTERDVLRRLVAAQLDPGTTTVGEVMTSSVLTVEPTTEIDEVASLMQRQRIRHVPVCSPDGDVFGLVSIGDINAFHVRQQASEIGFLNNYVFGRA